MGLSDDCRALVGQGVPVDARLKDDRKSLTAGLLQTLRDLGLGFTTWEREGDAPLHLAARFDCAATAEVLLANGADVRAREFFRYTPLHTAAMLRRRGGDITVEERTEMIGVIDTKLGGGWGVMQPIYRRSKKRRAPRRRRAVG